MNNISFYFDFAKNILADESFEFCSYLISIDFFYIIENLHFAIKSRNSSFPIKYEKLNFSVRSTTNYNLKNNSIDETFEIIWFDTLISIKIIEYDIKIYKEIHEL